MASSAHVDAKSAGVSASCSADSEVHGFTALSFMGRAAEPLRLKDQLEQLSELPVTTGPDSVLAALRGVHTVDIETPQPEILDEHYRWFMEESNMHVALA